MVIFNKSRCYNGGEQHKFEPRYTYRPVKPIGSFEWNGDAPEGIFQVREYLYDICIWCGKTIRRGKDEPK